MPIRLELVSIERWAHGWFEDRSQEFPASSIPDALSAFRGWVNRQPKALVVAWSSLPESGSGRVTSRTPTPNPKADLSVATAYRATVYLKAGGTIEEWDPLFILDPDERQAGLAGRVR